MSTIQLEEFNDTIKSSVDLLNYKDKQKIREILLKQRANSTTTRSWFRKAKPAPVPAEIYDILRPISEQQKALLEMQDLSFKIIWDFLQFCRWAEKVVFCDNEPDSGIYVDSDLMQYTERNAIFNIGDSANFEILVKLERIENPKYNDKLEFIDASGGESKFLNSMTLVITRQFGKKMKNTFIIVNGQVEYNDSSDQHLLAVVNEIIAHSMHLKYGEVIDTILNQQYLHTDKKRLPPLTEPLTRVN